MDAINRHPRGDDRKAEHDLNAAREAARMQANREELVERITRAVPEDGVVQGLEGVFLARASLPMGLIHGVIRPCFCVIAQGSKEILLGDSRYRYDPDHYLIATLEMPSISQILEARPERPYLSIRIDLTPSLVASVIEEVDQGSGSGNANTAANNARAMNVSRLDVNLQDAVVRLIRLLEMPTEAPILMPLIQREIVYRLLRGQQGVRLRHLAGQGSYAPHITRAVERIRQDYDQPLRIEDLARELGMSVSGLHHRFKAVTAMSPLQFQKQLRLQEARRLMLNENLDAASAAYRVGYRDPAYFSREYKSLFGVPPIRHVKRLREEARVGEEG